VAFAIPQRVSDAVSTDADTWSVPAVGTAEKRKGGGGGGRGGTWRRHCTGF